MRYRFSIEFSKDSAIIQLHDLNEDETYSIMIGPKKSAIFFTSLLLDSIEHRSDTTFSIKGDFTRRNLGPAVCHAALSTERSLLKCDTPETRESRNFEVYPLKFATWLAETLERRSNTTIEYEHLINNTN
jgi:hypothetical protein